MSEPTVDSARNAGLVEEDIARAFHEAYERLAPEHDYKTREASAVAWENVPQANKRLMRAVVRDLIATSHIEPGEKVR